jgi:zinc protease
LREETAKQPLMSFSFQRFLRVTLVLVTSFGLAIPTWAAKPKARPRATVTVPVAVPTERPGPWLYKGSDIPPDPNWMFGTLPNGVRYALRRSGVPPQQVSIRVDIEAGSLNERDEERGFAHFMEHLSFRGSRYIADGEAIKTWQRLGATFGSDTNAATTLTQTIYKLDLPSATRTGLEESVKILSGMMMAPEISAKGVETERRTVLAEARERLGAGMRIGDATTALYFAGQPLANRTPIGTTEALNGATPSALRAFHDRWYRPERAIVVISGDGDPVLFEQLVAKYFSDWKGVGRATPDPDFGKPVDGKPVSKAITEAGAPLVVSMAWLRPWIQKNDTIAYNQGKLVDLVALRLINRRLEERARAGGSFIQAQVDQDDVARSADGTFVQIVPLGDDWQAALRDVRAVIADAMLNPSSQEDINREAGEFFSALQVGVETQRAEAAAKQADDLIEAVNIRETVATAQVALDVFSGIKDGITPDAILVSTRKLFAGIGPRALLTSPTLLTGVEADLATAIMTPVTALASMGSGSQVNFAQMPSLGKPGKIKKREAISVPQIDVERVTFKNGVTLIVSPNPSEQGKVYVNVRFGDGMKALPADKGTPAWAGPAALMASGIGPFDQNALDRLTSGRKINLSFDIADDAFQLRAQTRASDLTDQLRLMASALTLPRWDPAPVQRARASYLTGYDTLDSSPGSVLGRDLGGLLRGGDARWSTPSRAQIEALTPEAFRAFWEPLLKTGPIEVMVFGDMATDDAIAATAASFGALKKRSVRLVSAQQASPKGVTATATPLVRAHTGSKEQAAAVLAWPLGGGLDGVYEARKLDLLASIFNDRMFSQLREEEGASYSPNVDSSWPFGLASGGNFIVTSQLKPEGFDRFFAISKGIAADLAAKPVTADELARVINPLHESIARASSGNMFWLGQLTGASRDPRRIAALRSLVTDYLKITPAELQETARKWLAPEKAFMLEVKPK